MRVMQCAEKPSIIFKTRAGDKPLLAEPCQAPVSPPLGWLFMPDPTSRQTPSAAAPIAVLDTNVLLDLLLFQDRRGAPLLAALQSGRLLALSTQAMFDELDDVLTRPFAAGWAVAANQVGALARNLCRLVVSDGLPERGLRPAPRCRDPDDQKFIDLAWSLPAAWLISRDRAVLALARPALARGLRIGTPEVWTQSTRTTTPTLADGAGAARPRAR